MLFAVHLPIYSSFINFFLQYILTVFLLKPFSDFPWPSFSLSLGKKRQTKKKSKLELNKQTNNQQTNSKSKRRHNTHTQIQNQKAYF